MYKEKKRLTIISLILMTLAIIALHWSINEACVLFLLSAIPLVAIALICLLDNREHNVILFIKVDRMGGKIPTAKILAKYIRPTTKNLGIPSTVSLAYSTRLCILEGSAFEIEKLASKLKKYCEIHISYNEEEDWLPSEDMRNKFEPKENLKYLFT